MGSETGSGESRVDALRKGDYADSIISSHRITGEIDIEVPPGAEYMTIEYGISKQVTFYKWKSRPDLVRVPDGWRDNPVKFGL